MISTNTQKIAAQFRLAGWGEAVKERIADGQSISAFCNEHGISKTTYYYRQKKVREAACSAMIEAQNAGTSVVPSGWAQLAEVEPVSASVSSLTVEISGCRVDVNADTDTALLVKVCALLKSL